MDAAVQETALDAPLLTEPLPQDMKNKLKFGKEQWQIVIELPIPPSQALSLSRSLSLSQSGEGEGAVSLSILCGPAELCKDLKNLVVEMEGYWLGAFALVKAGAEDQILDDWKEISSVFTASQPEKICKIKVIPFDEAEMKSHVMRFHQVSSGTYSAIQARQPYRSPKPVADGPVDAGLTMYTSIRDTVDVQASDDHAFTNWSKADDKAPLKSWTKRRRDLSAKSAIPPCLKSFSISPWSPPSQQYRLQGHLLYLAVVTLEGEYLHIVATVQGFFVDKSDNAHFDTLPRKPPHQYHQSLFSVLLDHSPKFATAIQQLTTATVPIHPDLFATAPIQNCHAAAPWLVDAPAPLADPFRSQIAFLSTGCTDPEFLPTARDWSDEFTMIRELPKGTIPERLLRERLLSKLQYDMSAAATRSVIGIVHGDILPANPTDPPNMHTVVHQNLLFVPAVDSLDSYVHLGGDEAVQQSVVKDVLGARILTALDVPDMHISPSVVVDYLGQRWMAQTIMPGLLSSSRAEQEAALKDHPNGTADHDSDDGFEKIGSPKSSTTRKTPTVADAHGFQVAYGSADTDHPEKQYVADPGFHELAQKIATHLHLALHKVYDTSGNATELWTSGEVKGVTGQDCKKYFIDLYRLQPVDVNFLESDIDGPLASSPFYPEELELPAPDTADYKYPHRFVLLRQEALEQYRESELRTWIYSRIAEGNSKRDEEKQKQEALVRAVQPDEASRRAEIEAIVESIQQPQTIININEFGLAYNPDAFVERKDQSGSVPVDEEDPSVKAVRGASSYLRQNIIHSFLSEAINTNSVPADTFQLTKQLHTKGINMRYLGYICSQATMEILQIPERHHEFARQGLRNLIAALEKEMVVRACKHLIRKLLRKRELFEVSACLSHFLNCLIGFFFNPRPSPQTAHLPASQRERSWISMTPESLRRDIRIEVAKRFRYNLRPSYFDQDMKKAQVLREVCLRSGLQLQVQEYILDIAEQPPTSIDDTAVSRKAAKKAAKAVGRKRTTTFEPEDIIHISPLVKDIPHKSTLADETFERGSNLLSSGSIAIGEALVTDAINYYEQIYGSVHTELAARYHELAVIYHQLSLPISRACNLWEQSKRSNDHDDRVRQKMESGFENEESYLQAKGEFRQMVDSAVQMNRQSIIVAERTLGCDHWITASQYIDLGILEHAADNIHVGLALLRHGIELYGMIHGSDHPEAIRGIINASQILTQSSGHAAAIPILQTSVELHASIRGEGSVMTGTALSQLANAQALHGDLLSSKGTARKAADVFQNRLGKTDEKTMEAENLYEILCKAIINRERGEQAKLERLARRLGLQEDRAKQLLDKRNGKKKAVEAVETESPVEDTMDAAHRAIAQMPIEELVKFIQGPPPSAQSNKSKNGRAKR